MPTGEDWRELIEQLRGVEYRFGVITADSPVHRVEFAPGLSDTEIAHAEGMFGFRFPPDLRAFLGQALPTGPQFPDWRSGDTAELKDWLDVPLSGLLFDVEHNGFWLDEWGPYPQAMRDALARATDLVCSAPRLIPIYAHRMMPDEPHAPGNPVFSIHQTDIIHYGVDLADYLRNEFHLPAGAGPTSDPRQIRFWNVDRFQDTRWNEAP